MALNVKVRTPGCVIRPSLQGVFAAVQHLGHLALTLVPVLQAVSVLAGVILLVLISLIIAQAGEGDWFIFRGEHHHLYEIISCSCCTFSRCATPQQAAPNLRARSCCAADIYDAATHIGKGSWSSVVLGAFLGGVACALLAFVWHLSTDAGSGLPLWWAPCCRAVMQTTTTASCNVQIGWPVTCPLLQVSSVPSRAL